MSAAISALTGSTYAMIKSASVDGWMCWLESNRRPTRGGGAGPLISILSLISWSARWR
jgi:hypothetical protein